MDKPSEALESVLERVIDLWPRSSSEAEVDIRRRLGDIAAADLDSASLKVAAKGRLRIVSGPILLKHAAKVLLSAGGDCLPCLATFAKDEHGSWRLSAMEEQCAVCFGSGINDGQLCDMCFATGWGVHI